MELREYLRVFRLRDWGFMLGVAIIAGLSTFYQYVPIYEAEARLVLDPVVTAPGLGEPLDPTGVETESQILASDPVAALVREELGSTASTGDLLDNAAVHGVAGARVLEVIYSSPDRRFAMEAANSFARSYIEYRSEVASQNLQKSREGVEEEVQVVSLQLSDVRNSLEQATEPGAASFTLALQTRRDLLLTRLGLLQQELQDLEVGATQPAEVGQIIEVAELPTSPVSPGPFVLVAVAMVLGFGLGGVLALIWERIKDRVQSREDVEGVTQAPVLAVIPRYRLPRRRISELVIENQRNGRAGEAYRTLRSTLHFALAEADSPSIVLTSPSANEGTSSTTANLGVAYAMAGYKVALVSANVRRPKLGHYFGVSDETSKGLVNWLVGEEENLEKLICRVGIANLGLLPSGPFPPNSAELLMTPRLAELIILLGIEYDRVIFDSSPILGMADTLGLVSQVKSVALVVNPTRTSRSDALSATELIQRAGGSLIGTIVNGVNPLAYPYYYRPSGDQRSKLVSVRKSA